VELHGGSVRAHSEGLGKGSEFAFTLPLKNTRVGSHFSRPNAASAMPETRPAKADYSFLTGRRILVIDDEADTSGFLRRVLAERGAQVAVADSAADGLRHVLQEKPDAVICDVSMPIEDGYSFIRRLRRAEDGDRAPTPAAALTALARLEDKQRALEAGFDEHHAKPIEPAELLSLVGKLLRLG